MSESAGGVFLGLGANLGDRMDTLQGAVAKIAGLPSTRVVACSSVYETEPWGNEDQPAYLNAVVEICTALLPHDLLSRALLIEDGYHRQRGTRWSPRTLDIDILVYAGQVVDDPGLKVPHPLLASRNFVLVPLAEIAPRLRLPGSDRTIRDLLESASDSHRVVKLKSRLGVPP